MNHGYDNVSFFYDGLSKMVFGNTLLQAQSCLLPTIMPADHLLIAGGGSGWILEAITRVHQSGLTITYIDASSKMIARAKERNVENNKVTFISSPVEDVPLSRGYDVVITPFLFDNFTADVAAGIFRKLNDALRPNGHWLHTDFTNSPLLLHRAILRTMYLFFGKACGIQTDHLPDMETLFGSYHYQEVASHTFMNGFISASDFKKNVDKKTRN